MDCSKISNIVTNEFSNHYSHFKEFQLNEAYSEYWDKCMEAINNEELLQNIIFCNDIFCIPPVKTFLTYYKNDFIKITGKEIPELDAVIKKNIGAFWGMVFKFTLGYKGQKSVSVSMKDFSVVTATYFTKEKTNE